MDENVAVAMKYNRDTPAPFISAKGRGVLAERIKEIGIIRSIGTKRSEVMKMFLYEAFILGLIGSGIGGVLSFAGGFIAISVMLQDTSYLFTPQTLFYIPYGMVIGLIVTLASGLYPAWKAANLNPIEALRFE